MLQDIWRRYEYRYTFIYEKGTSKVSLIKHYSDKGKLTSSEHYEYDIYNNPVKRIIYNTLGEVEYEYTYEYVYDEHHNFTRRSEYRNRRPFSITKRDIVYQ